LRFRESIRTRTGEGPQTNAKARGRRSTLTAEQTPRRPATNARVPPLAERVADVLADSHIHRLQHRDSRIGNVQWKMISGALRNSEQLSLSRWGSAL